MQHICLLQFDVIFLLKENLLFQAARKYQLKKPQIFNSCAAVKKLLFCFEICKITLHSLRSDLSGMGLRILNLFVSVRTGPSNWGSMSWNQPVPWFKKQTFVKEGKFTSSYKEKGLEKQFNIKKETRHAGLGETETKKRKTKISIQLEKFLLKMYCIMYIMYRPLGVNTWWLKLFNGAKSKLKISNLRKLQFSQMCLLKHHLNPNPIRCFNRSHIWALRSY